MWRSDGKTPSHSSIVTQVTDNFSSQVSLRRGLISNLPLTSLNLKYYSSLIILHLERRTWYSEVSRNYLKVTFYSLTLWCKIFNVKSLLKTPKSGYASGLFHLQTNQWNISIFVNVYSTEIQRWVMAIINEKCQVYKIELCVILVAINCMIKNTVTIFT